MNKPKRKPKMSMSAFTTLALATIMGGGIPKSLQPQTMDEGLRKGQYPFSEEEIEKIRSIEDFKERKKYIKELKKKYAGQAKK